MKNSNNTKTQQVTEKDDRRKNNQQKTKGNVTDHRDRQETSNERVGEQQNQRGYYSRNGGHNGYRGL